MAHHDQRHAFVDNAQLPSPFANGSGGWDGGEPSWVSGMRADIRGLGDQFAQQIRVQTIVVCILALVAMCLNAALVLANMSLQANTSGLRIETTKPS